MKRKRMIISLVLTLFIFIGSFVGVAAYMGKRLIIKQKYYDEISKELNDVFYLASICANSHNSQPWKINLNIESQEVTIVLDESRTLNVVDPDKREAYISIGCYLGNIEKSFNAYGYTVNYDITEENIKVNYVKTEDIIDHELIALINKRHTNKEPYQTDKLDDSILSDLHNKYPELIVYEIGSESYLYLKEISWNAIITQSISQEYRDELNKWMRFSDEEVLEKLDGISAEMIGLKGIVKTFYYWTTTHDNASGDKFANQGNNTAKKQLENNAAMAVLCSDSDIVSLINLGIKLQNILLELTKNDIAVQPISAALEVAPFKDHITSDLSLDMDCQVIMRLGYVKEYGTNQGLRRSLVDYVTIVS